MATPEELKAKKDKFIEAYLSTSNGAEAARRAGYAASRAAVTASELLKDPYVTKMLQSAQNIKKDSLTDALGSIDDIFDSNANQALSMLANEARTDPQAAKQFLELKLKFDAKKEETLGEYAELSTDQIITRAYDLIESTKLLVQRVVETLRETPSPSGSDVSVKPSAESPRPEEESMGSSPQENSQPPENP